MDEMAKEVSEFGSFASKCNKPHVRFAKDDEEGPGVGKGSSVQIVAG